MILALPCNRGLSFIIFMFMIKRRWLHNNRLNKNIIPVEEKTPTA
jgi:hypothetical protein